MQADYVSIFSATAVSLFIGLLWYGPVMFGKVWFRVEGVNGKNRDEIRDYRRKVFSMCGFQALAILLQTYILSVFIHTTQEIFSWSAVTLLLWFGLIVPTQISSAVWENVPRGMRFNKFFINVTYYLVIMLMSAYIMVHWSELIK